MGRFCLILFMWGMCGCATIHFDNGPETGSEEYSSLYSVWHHDGILSLVEFSDPVNLESYCGKEVWNSVRVQQGPPQVIITLLVGALYSPWDVQYACANSHGKKKKKIRASRSQVEKT